MTMFRQFCAAFTGYQYVVSYFHVSMLLLQLSTGALHSTGRCPMSSAARVSSAGCVQLSQVQTLTGQQACLLWACSVEESATSHEQQQ